MAFQIPVYGEVYPGADIGIVKVTDESQDVLYTDTSPVTIGTIKANKNIIVIGAIVNTKTLWAGTTPTLALGITGTGDYYLTNTEIVCTEAGVKKLLSLKTALEQSPTSDLNVIVTIGGSSLSAGVTSFRLIYVDLDPVN